MKLNPSVRQKRNKERPMFQCGMEFNPYGLFHGLFIPNCIAQSAALSDQEKLLMGRLYQYAGRNGRAFPSRVRLAIELAWELRKLDRVISRLKVKKLIKTKQWNPQSPSEYIFLWHQIYEAKYPKIVEQEEDLATVKKDRGATVTDDNHNKFIYEKGHLSLSETEREESRGNNHVLGSNTSAPAPEKRKKDLMPNNAAPRLPIKQKKLQPETIEILDYWNSHSTLTSHKVVRRRTVGSYHAQSRLVQDLDVIIRNVLHGTFYSKFSDVREVIKNRQITVNDIKKAIDRMALACTPEYSRNPKKVGILDFFSNMRAKLGSAQHILYRWRFPLLHFMYYEPVKLEDTHKQKSTQYAVIVRKVIDKLNAGNVTGTRYNKVVVSVEKAVSLIDRRANGNRGQLITMLPELIYDSLLNVGKGLTVEALPLGIYRLESLMEERLMLKPQYRGN